MIGCPHTPYEWPCQDCIELTPEEKARGERLRSLQFTFSGGQSSWHDGPTIKEFEREVREDSKRTGIEPQYEGPKSRWI